MYSLSSDKFAFHLITIEPADPRTTSRSTLINEIGLLECSSYILHLRIHTEYTFELAQAPAVSMPSPNYFISNLGTGINHVVLKINS